MLLWCPKTHPARDICTKYAFKFLKYGTYSSVFSLRKCLQRRTKGRASTSAKTGSTAEETNSKTVCAWSTTSGSPTADPPTGTPLNSPTAKASMIRSSLEDQRGHPGPLQHPGLPMSNLHGRWYNRDHNPLHSRVHHLLSRMILGVPFCSVEARTFRSASNIWPPVTHNLIM